MLTNDFPITDTPRHAHAYTAAGRTDRMEKRTLAKNLALLGLAFVALLHTGLSLYFDTDLMVVGVAILIVVVVGLLLVNL